MEWRDGDLSDAEKKKKKKKCAELETVCLFVCCTVRSKLADFTK